MQKQWDDIEESVIHRCRDWNHWQGSHYELSMAYPTASLNQHSRLRLFCSLWKDAHLLGVVDDPGRFGQPRQRFDDIDTDDASHYYGYIFLADNKITGCASTFIRSSEITWFSLYIPLGLLEPLFPVKYPVTYEENAWITAIDTLFATIGARIYKEKPFKLAVMGEEASAFPIEHILIDLAHDPGLLVPEVLFTRRNISPYGTHLDEGLWWTGGKEPLTKEQ